MPSLNNLVNPPDRTGRGSHPSIWRGLVVNITAQAVWVRVPTLASDDLTATNTIPGDLQPGDRVIIGAVEGRVENLVVIAKENPSVPAHVHQEGDIQWGGWGDLTLQAPWAAGTDPEMYPGLRYRVDSRFVYINGHITGGPGTIATLPFTVAYEGRIGASLTNGGFGVLRLQKSGVLSSTATTTFLVNGYAPLA